MTAPNSHSSKKLAIAGLGAVLTTLAGCATPGHDGLTQPAPYFANRTAAQPIAAIVEVAAPAEAQRATATTLAPSSYLHRDYADPTHKNRSLLGSSIQDEYVDVDRQPRGMFYLRPAVGTVEIETSPSGSPSTKSDTDAVLVELGFEGTGKVVGGGFRLSAYTTDDDLLETSSAIDTSSDGFDFFAHLTIRPGGSRFRVPIRIGPEVKVHSFSTSVANSDVDWLSVGGAVEIAPEIDFVRTNNVVFSLYGRGHFGVGVAGVSTDVEDYTTSATTVAGEVGLRLQLAKFMLSGGYMFNNTTYDESDPETTGSVTTRFDETSWAFDGIFLMLGLRW
jgi:hypothetical protein